MPTVKEVLAYGTQILNQNKIGDATRDARLLLMHLLSCDRATLIINNDKLVEEEIVATYFKYIDRRKNHEPLQYITHYQEFMGLPFYVDQNVLIPRQDTELLVEKLIALPWNHHPIGLEIGVGSGCISVSLLHYISNLTMVCSDISQAALDIAAKNASINACIPRIKFVHSDLFANIPQQKFDFIVSNPPYIPKCEMNQLQPEVLDFEPAAALTDSGDGLAFYRAIATEAKKYEIGILAFEIGYNQGPDVTKILEIEGYQNIQLFYDYNNKHRVIIAQQGEI